METDKEIGYLKGKVEALYDVVKEHMEREEQDRQELKDILKEFKVETIESHKDLSTRIEQVEDKVRSANLVYRTVRACGIFLLGVLSMNWDEAIRALKGVI